MDSIITIKNLIKIYPGVVETKALKGIDLSIQRGGTTAIVGQSGSGKSTLLNLIGTLDTLSSGEIIIDGENIANMDHDKKADFRNKTIGFVFQFHYLLPEFSVIENVLLPYWINNDENYSSTKNAEDLLDYVGILDIKDKLATDISGGQKQRTAIARALMNKPKILLADEPTGNLDSDSSGKVLDLFEKISKEQKTTFILITHDDRVAKRADTIVELHDGEIVNIKKN